MKSTSSAPKVMCESALALALDWKAFVKIDPRYFRPSEVDILIGDASKAEKALGWRPTQW